MKLVGRYYLYEGGPVSSNVYLIDAKNLTIVDTGIGFNMGGLLREIRSDGFELKKIKFIINTHGHPDHIGGNTRIVRSSGATVMMHKADAKTLDKLSMLPIQIPLPRMLNPKVDNYLGDTGDELDLGGVVLEIIHTPGHSEGSVCLYDREHKVLISGDTAFAYSIGRWDLPGGNLNKLRQSIEKISKLDVEYMLPGHMDYLAGKDKIKESLNYCMRSLSVV